MKFFFIFLKPYQLYLFGLLIIGFFPKIIALVLPLISKEIIDDITIHKNYKLLYASIYYVGLLLIINLIVSTCHSYFSTKLFLNIERDISLFLFKKILKKKNDFFLENLPGNIYFRLKNDVKTIISYWEIILSALPFQLVMLFSLIFLIKWNFILTIIIMILIIIQSNIIVVFRPLLYKESKNNKEINECLASHNVNVFNRISIVKAYSGEKYEKEKYLNIYHKYKAISLRIKLITQISTELISIIGNSWSFFIIWFGGKQVLTGQMTIGELLGFLMYANLLANPFTYFTNFMLSLQSVKVSYKRIFEYINAPEENYADDFSQCAAISMPTYEDKLRIEKIKNLIEIRNLKFSYNIGEPVIKNLSCTFPSKGLFLIFGCSGSGKSTLCNLLIRKLDFTNGEILFCKHDIRDIPVDIIRKYIIYQDQSNFTIDDTIEQNIKYGLKNIKKKDLIESIKLSSSEFIFTLPYKLNSNFAQNKFRVSCGQAQRIAIARSILRQPKVLILDEPTSSIDMKNEERILESLNKLKNKHCIIMVTHNERIKRMADKIISLS